MVSLSTRSRLRGSTWRIHYNTVGSNEGGVGFVCSSLSSPLHSLRKRFSFFPSFSFKSIFRLLVGKPDTRVIKITHSAAGWPDISIQGRHKICIPFILYGLLLFCVSSDTLECQKVTFEISQTACLNSTHCTVHTVCCEDKSILKDKRSIRFERCLLW